MKKINKVNHFYNENKTLEESLEDLIFSYLEQNEL